MDSLPQELIDRIIDWACLPATTVKGTDATTGVACSLVKSSWAHRSRQNLFGVVVLDPERFVRWCQTIPASAKGPSSFVHNLSLNDFTANRLIDHIEHLKAFVQVTNLHLGHLDGETFDREKIEQCFAHFGPTVQILSFFIPQYKTSLFAPLINLFTRAIQMDILSPLIEQDVNEMEYKPLPNLEQLRLVLDSAKLDYQLLKACTNLRGAYIHLPPSTSRSQFNGLFIRCANTLESLYIGPEIESQSKSPSHHAKGPLIDSFCKPRQASSLPLVNQFMCKYSPHQRVRIPK